jgi:DNA-binding NtrC family response regulator
MRQNCPTPNALLTVLVVDDDPIMCSCIEESLETLGFKTITVPHGLSAIQLILDKNPEVHLVISDFKMPYLNGVETLTALQALRPGLKTILCSGTTKQECFEEHPLEDCIFLSKPFGIKDLDAAVNLALAYVI